MARKKMIFHHWDGVLVLDLGDMEIWDGADLSLLRDTLHEVIELNGCNSLGVNMENVKYIPSGFFGMLFDWHERGVEIRLYAPQPNVAEMLWFRKFFQCERESQFVLNSDQEAGTRLETDSISDSDEVWEADDCWTSDSIKVQSQNHG